MLTPARLVGVAPTPLFLSRTTTHSADARSLAALESVFREQHDFVWGLARSLGADRELADDIVQEVFLVVRRKLSDYEDHGKARAWLAAITHRVLADERKSTKRRLLREQRSRLPVPARDPEQESSLRQGAQQLQTFLSRLPDPQREVFIFVEIEGLTSSDTASILGIRRNTVASRLRLARARFAAFVQQQDAQEVTP